MRLVAIAAAATALLLATAGGYGYHRDELYFLRAGAEPAFGYADQPPLTPLLAHALDVLFGGSLLGLRAPSALMAGLVVLVTGLIARELGASRGRSCWPPAAWPCPLCCAQSATCCPPARWTCWSGRW